MTDKFPAEVRSKIMSRIRKVDTKPEKLVRSFLFKNGFRFRIHYKGLPGNPDIVFPKLKTLIFVNGCFWHSHENCKLNKKPKTNRNYWIPKLKKNKERDKRNHKTLKKMGWRVIVIWECELEEGRIDQTLRKLNSKLNRLIN